MHMNAPPRTFWNSFGNLASSYGPHLPSQISHGMTTNDTNAWSSQRPMTESLPVNQGWGQSFSKIDDMTSLDDFPLSFSAQPYASLPNCAQVTAGNQYGAQNYLPDSFRPNMPLLTGHHQGQVIWTTPVHYQRSFETEAFVEPFHHRVPQILGGGRSKTVATLNNNGIWHDINLQSNSMNPTDALRHIPYGGPPRHDFRTWPVNYGCGSGMLNPITQQSTVSPQRLSLQTISSPTLSHSESTTFWTPLSSPACSSRDFPGLDLTGGESSLEYVPSEVSNSQEENDKKPTRSLQSSRWGEDHPSQAADTPFISTAPTRERIDQSNGFSAKEAAALTRPMRRLVPLPPTTAPSFVSRKAQDDFLLRARANGMSYKEIRRRGNFSEAESTLRGRLRALKKNPSERVRKPEWTQKDDELLVKKVNDLSEQNWSLRSQAPWRQVSEYIWDNGGSYRFGYATCRKRWEELHALNDD